MYGHVALLPVGGGAATASNVRHGPVMDHGPVVPFCRGSASPSSRESDPVAIQHTLW